VVGDDQRLDGLACIATTRRDREAETVGLPYAVDQSMRTAKQAPKEANRRTIIGPHAAAAPGLLIFTGARLREILHLKWDQIDFERGLLLPTSKTGKKTIVLNAPALAILNIAII
jgi:integrase